MLLGKAPLASKFILTLDDDQFYAFDIFPGSTTGAQLAYMGWKGIFLSYHLAWTLLLKSLSPLL